MQKVMHILTDSNIGGAGRLLINYLHNFDRSKFDIVVVLPKDAALKPLVEAEGYPVTRYLCGSDPTSLDAVVLNERIVVLDGTAPHSRDMVYPGAASSLIDVSRFWKCDLLRKNREEIIACTARKKAAFASGTRYLAAAELAEAESHEAIARCIDPEKLEQFCTRIVPKKGLGAVGKALPYRTHGIGMRGLACTVGFAAAEQYGIADGLGAGTVLLEALGNAYLRRGVDVRLGFHPISDRITSLYIPSQNRLYRLLAEDDGGVDKTIHMTRFAYDNAVHFFFRCQGTQTGKIFLFGSTLYRFYPLCRNQQGITAGYANGFGTNI